MSGPPQSRAARDRDRDRGRTGDTPEGAWDALAGLVAAHGFTLNAEAEDGDTRGHTDYRRKVVNVDPKFSLPERVHVLVHELGHVRCEHGPEGRKISREQRETEADSIAHIVLKALGFDISSSTVDYVAGWLPSDPEERQAVIRAAAATIRNTAVAVLAEIEEQS